MTITVVQDLTSTPPRNRVTVSSGAGTVMSSVSLWRNDVSGQTLLRTQPSAGFSSQLVDDYECPYGVATTYGWTANYFTTAGFTTLFNETWSSVAAWTQTGGGFAVSAGTVHNTLVGSGVLSRDFTNSLYRITIASLAVTGTGGVANIYLSPNGAFYTSSIWAMQVTTAGLLSVSTNSGGSSSTSISAASPITIDMGATTVTFSGTGGSVTLPYTNTAGGRLSLVPGAGGSVTATFGAIQVQSYGSTSSITETSAAATLTPADMWLIHPTVPGLSLQVKHTDAAFVTLTTVDATTNAANATTHEILGSTLPIETTTGPRASDATSMKLRTYTAAQETALVALMKDQTPLLINVPPAWGSVVPYAFYAVGDVPRDRPVRNGSVPWREFTLPLRAVRSPVAAIQSSTWSYSQLLLQYVSYDALKARFTSYSNLLADV